MGDDQGIYVTQTKSRECLVELLCWPFRVAVAFDLVHCCVKWMELLQVLVVERHMAGSVWEGQLHH